MGGAPAGTARKTLENEVRTMQMQEEEVKSEATMRGMEYSNLFSKDVEGARRDAESAVTAERSKGITDQSKLLTQYEAQERRRLFEAKKGAGQVGTEDLAITSDQAKQARDFLGQGSDYWDARRGAAGEEAAGTARTLFDKTYGTEKDYVAKGSKALGIQGIRDAYTAKSQGLL